MLLCFMPYFCIFKTIDVTVTDDVIRVILGRAGTGGVDTPPKVFRK